MKAPLKVAMASVLALATAAPAMAQSYQHDSQYDQNGQYDQNDQYDHYDQGDRYQPTPEYRRDLQRYDQRRQSYEQRRNEYNARRRDYAQARREYERRLADYNRARAEYDARYGYGAYARAYGPAPTWSDRHWAYYLTPAPGPYAPAAPYYGANTTYTSPIHCDNSGAVGAGAIGALAGAVLGSQLSAPGRHTENAVLGGLVGAGIGAAVGHEHDKYKCDQRGPYFSYNETIPYREGPYHSGRYAYYERMRCRLAPAPVDRNADEYRYVRVCPDAEGRYRIVG